MTSFLEQIAKAYVGEPVTVELAPLDSATWGDAARKNGRWRIRLNVRLLTEGRDYLAHTFFHELGHLVLGHVPNEPKPAAFVGLRERVEARPGTRLHRLMLAQDRRNEADANAWGKRELDKIRELTDKDGLTFEILAIMDMAKETTE